MKTIEIPCLPVSLSTLTKWLDKSDKKNPQIRFKLELTGPGGTMQFDYSGGILAFGCPNQFIVCEEGKLHQVNNCITKGQRTIYDERNYLKAINEIFKAAKVDELDVIHSLLSDSDAGNQPFREFCSELGYDTDGRAAFKIWETCSEQGAEFRKVVGKHMEELRELTAEC